MSLVTASASSAFAALAAVVSSASLLFVKTGDQEPKEFGMLAVGFVSAVAVVAVLVRVRQHRSRVSTDEALADVYARALDASPLNPSRQKSTSK